MTGSGGELEVGQETTAKRAVVWAVDWPGWCRVAKDPLAARQALIDCESRYTEVAVGADLTLPAIADADLLRTVDAVRGDASTDFGCPARSRRWIVERCQRPMPSGWPDSSARPGQSSIGS